MNEIKNDIKDIDELLNDEVDENKLLEKSKKKINKLREKYKEDKSNFDNKDLENLKENAKKIKAIKDFKEELEEFEYLEFQEEVDEVIGRLYPIISTIEGLSVTQRIEKEIRVLQSRRDKLPREGVQRLESEKLKGINQLSANAHKCKKCGSRMVLREGNNTFFWGCSTFPGCWGQHWLTKEEKNILGL